MRHVPERASAWAGCTSKASPGASFDMDEVAGNYQPSVRIPYPPLPEGAKVEITAPGGPLGPLRLESVGIAPLEFTARVQPVSGQPLALDLETARRRPTSAASRSRWTSATTAAARARSSATSPTAASLAIPAAQITTLLGLGISGFPTVVVTRVASGSTATRLGRATLRVVASVERAVEIEGLHSCTANEDCPAGMTCQVDLKCK